MKKAIAVICSIMLISSLGTVTNVKADAEDGDIIIISPSNPDDGYHDVDDLELESGESSGSNENTNHSTSKPTETTKAINGNINEKGDAKSNGESTGAALTKKPAKVKVISATRKNKKSLKAKITLKKIKGVSGYQVKYSYHKKLKKYLTKNCKKNKFTLKKLKAGKKYYIKARAYVKNGNKKVYGSWSKKKLIKIKKNKK